MSIHGSAATGQVSDWLGEWFEDFVSRYVEEMEGPVPSHAQKHIDEIRTMLKDPEK